MEDRNCLHGRITWRLCKWYRSSFNYVVPKTWLYEWYGYEDTSFKEKILELKGVTVEFSEPFAYGKQERIIFTKSGRMPRVEELELAHTYTYIRANIIPIVGRIMIQCNLHWWFHQKGMNLLSEVKIVDGFSDDDQIASTNLSSIKRPSHQWHCVITHFTL